MLYINFQIWSMCSDNTEILLQNKARALISTVPGNPQRLSDFLQSNSFS